MRQNIDLGQALANADLGRIATALEGIRAALEAQQQPVPASRPLVFDYEFMVVSDDAHSTSETYAETWHRHNPDWQDCGKDIDDWTMRIFARPRQQPAPAQDAAGDGDAGRDWKAAFDELQHEFDLYRWSAGERMTRPSGAPLRLNSWGEPFCPVCNETMEWLQDDDLDDDDARNYWRWHCTGCGTELERGEHPSPAKLRDVP